MGISERRDMRATANGLLELAPDRLIALCRFLLAGISLSAILLDPTQPARFVFFTYAVLGGYLVMAAAIAALVTHRRLSPIEAYMAHALDIAVAVMLMLFTEGPTSPFFAFFTFNLMAATVRWKTRGAIVTSALLLLVYGTMLAALVVLPSFDSGTDEINRTMIRVAYLAVTAILMTYLGAYLELGRQRILDLARWPPSVGDGSEPAYLGAILAHAAQVVRVPRLVVVWERVGDPDRHVVEYRDGVATQLGKKVGDGLLIPRELEGKAFATEDVSTGMLMFADGAVAKVAQPVLRSVSDGFDIHSFVSAPLRGSACRGRVFLLDRPQWSPDHIALAEAIGARLGVDLDHLALRDARELEAAEGERMRLSRDVHDGVLQGLTAADLQLTFGMRKSDAEARELLSSVRQIIKTEQRRLREFVETSREAAGGSGDSDIELLAQIAPGVQELGQRWGCSMGLDVDPPDAECDRPTARLLLHLLSEAVANASRHGKASSVSVELSIGSNALQARINDDGRGWIGLSGTYSWEELSERGIGPRSIISRVADAKGQLSLSTSPRGTELTITLPRREAA